MDFLVDSKKSYQIITLMRGITRDSKDAVISHIDESLKKGDKNFIIDFSYTKYIDSSGIGSLVASYKKVKASDGILCLFGAIPMVQKVFVSLNLPEDFWNYSSAAEITERYSL